MKNSGSGLVNHRIWGWFLASSVIKRPWYWWIEACVTCRNYSSVRSLFSDCSSSVHRRTHLYRSTSLSMGDFFDYINGSDFHTYHDTQRHLVPVCRQIPSSTTIDVRATWQKGRTGRERCIASTHVTSPSTEVLCRIGAIILCTVWFLLWQPPSLNSVISIVRKLPADEEEPSYALLCIPSLQSKTFCRRSRNCTSLTILIHAWVSASFFGSKSGVFVDTIT